MVVMFTENICDTWFDNSTWEGEFFEGIMQTILWTIVLQIVYILSLNYCNNKPWRDLVEKQPGGIEEFCVFARVFVQHTVSAILATLGLLLSNSRLIRHAALAEFGFEAFDIFRIWFLHFQGRLDKSLGVALPIATSFHHLPGIIAIIPGNYYLSDNIYYQKLVVTLLIPAPLAILGTLIVKTYDITNLVERTRFTIVHVLSLVMIIITRFYHFNLYSYEFFSDVNSYGKLNRITKCICVGYFVLLSLFNIMFSGIMILRLNKYATATKEDEIKKAGDAMIAGVNLNKFLFQFKDKSRNGGGGRKVCVRKLPYRRVLSQPDMFMVKEE